MNAGRPPPQRADTAQTAHAQPAPAHASASALAILDIEALLQGQSAVLIRHGQDLYRLQRTRQGKLILTK